MQQVRRDEQTCPKNLTFDIIPAKKDNFLFIEQKYGGHLGFYEGGLIYPSPLSWLDRLVVQLSDALLVYSSDHKIKIQEETSQSDSESSGTLSTGGDSDSEQIVATTKSSRPSFLCRRRTVSGPQGSSINAAGRLSVN